MTANPRETYFKYLKNVLGIKSILLEPELPLTFEQTFQSQTGHFPEAQEFDLIVLDHQSGLFSGVSSELWQKMKTAMKLGPTRALELHVAKSSLSDTMLIELLHLYPAQVVLILNSAPQRPGHKLIQGAQVIESFSPSLLVEAPQLKKLAWSDLQAAMKILGTVLI